MNAPEFSVIIPAFNAERWIAEAIESVLSQSVSAIECLVVDDGSTDHTRDVVSDLGSEVSYILQPHSGVSAARNLGASKARGDYLAFLDADDVWLPQKLELQRDLVSIDPPLGLGYGGYVVTDERLAQLRVVRAPHPADALRRVLFVEPGVLISSTGIMSSELFHRLGGFNEDFSTSADADLALRALLVSNAGCVEEPVALYRRHESQMHLDVASFESEMTTVLRLAFDSPLLPSELRQQHGRAMAKLNFIVASDALHQADHSNAVRHSWMGLRAHFPHAAGLFAAALWRRATQILHTSVSGWR